MLFSDKSLKYYFFTRGYLSPQEAILLFAGFEPMNVEVNWKFEEEVELKDKGKTYVIKYAKVLDGYLFRELQEEAPPLSIERAYKEVGNPQYEEKMEYGNIRPLLDQAEKANLRLKTLWSRWKVKAIDHPGTIHKKQYSPEQYIEWVKKNRLQQQVVWWNDAVAAGLIAPRTNAPATKKKPIDTSDLVLLTDAVKETGQSLDFFLRLAEKEEVNLYVCVSYQNIEPRMQGHEMLNEQSSFFVLPAQQAGCFRGSESARSVEVRKLKIMDGSRSSEMLTLLMYLKVSDESRHEVEEISIPGNGVEIDRDGLFVEEGWKKVIANHLPQSMSRKKPVSTSVLKDRYRGWNEFFAAWVVKGQKKVTPKWIKTYHEPNGLKITRKGKKQQPECTNKDMDEYIFKLMTEKQKK